MLTAAVQTLQWFQKGLVHKEGRAFVSLNWGLAPRPRPGPVLMQSRQIFRIEEMCLLSPLLELYCQDKCKIKME